jgi:hypothetical protein
MVEHPDKIEVHSVQVCKGCGASLEDDSEDCGF